MSTPGLVRTIAPEFESKTDVEIQAFLDIATLDTTLPVWGVRFDNGVAYLAAHYMVIAKRADGIAGPIVEEQVGDIRRKYGFSTSAKVNPLTSTSYGSVYFRMRKGIVKSPMVGGC